MARVSGGVSITKPYNVAVIMSSVTGMDNKRLIVKRKKGGIEGSENFYRQRL